MNQLDKKTKKIAIIAVAILVVIVVILCVVKFMDTKITQTEDSITHEAGVELVLEAEDIFKGTEDALSEITFDTSDVDVNMVGTYEATAEYKSKTYTIAVEIVDTTAPQVTFAKRILFTNDITTVDAASVTEGIYDASEYTATLIRFERTDNLKVMDDAAIEALLKTIPLPADEDELLALGTEEIPTEQGIYRSVLKAEDVHGNAAYEEVYVVLDTTGALIGDVADSTVYVSAENLSAEPTVDKSQYTITDNVDGTIAEDNITCELEVKDASAHEWYVHVSYTDRAGNESKADFLITVKENSNATDSGNSNSNGSSNSNSSTKYDPADTDKDGVVTPEESVAYISPEEQKLIDAGYGVVVKLDETTYGVLTKNGDDTINGKHCFEILDEYLENLGLEATSMYGGWMNMDNGWFVHIAEGVHEIDTSGNDW